MVMGGYKMKSELMNQNTSTHVLYSYESGDHYIKNAISYIIDGIEAGDSIILIENERNLKILFKQLENRLTNDQLEKINVISNFEFYLARGSYHAPAVLEQMRKTITPYLESDTPFRSWANVEWGLLEDPSQTVDWFEKETDKAVHEYGLKVVCAYEAARMPNSLQLTLEKSHPYIMTDENFYKSYTYDPSHMMVKKGDGS
jgi:MEDS: MEthanogen/methylotroph, DcmR Sensory domain